MKRMARIAAMECGGASADHVIISEALLRLILLLTLNTDLPSP